MDRGVETGAMSNKSVFETDSADLLVADNIHETLGKCFGVVCQLPHIEI